jgi:hypothetical protein
MHPGNGNYAKQLKNQCHRDTSWLPNITFFSVLYGSVAPVNFFMRKIYNTVVDMELNMSDDYIKTKNCLNSQLIKNS